MKYFEEAKRLWKAYVPADGQADTVQGEMLRGVEKLRWEAQNNGNVNWDRGFVILANFVRDTLLAEKSFSQPLKQEISADIDRLLNYKYPYIEDDLYDRLVDRVVEWDKEHPEPVAHQHNDKLTR